eukprot:TRINITY_DN3162_c0_g1_i4.p1 TRINITY_DN3162_c0_g1~~TRINITY_DN3162_c0_g1_i4.p1  ORF type:complete len:2308 (+),score=617.30 TRINITY_DN3162_c0_g1_i4:430-6924(+)
MAGVTASPVMAGVTASPMMAGGTASPVMAGVTASPVMQPKVECMNDVCMKGGRPAGKCLDPMNMECHKLEFKECNARQFEWCGQPQGTMAPLASGATASPIMQPMVECMNDVCMKGGKMAGKCLDPMGMECHKLDFKECEARQFEWCGQPQQGTRAPLPSGATAAPRMQPPKAECERQFCMKSGKPAGRCLDPVNMECHQLEIQECRAQQFEWCGPQGTAAPLAPGTTAAPLPPPPPPCTDAEKQEAEKACKDAAAGGDLCSSECGDYIRKCKLRTLGMERQAQCQSQCTDAQREKAKEVCGAGKRYDEAAVMLCSDECERAAGDCAMQDLLDKADKNCACAMNEQWDDCAPGCPLTCSASGAMMCTMQCAPGCRCRDGYVTINGECQPATKCPADKCTGFTWPPKEVTDRECVDDGDCKSDQVCLGCVPSTCSCDPSTGEKVGCTKDCLKTCRKAPEGSCANWKGACPAGTEPRLDATTVRCGDASGEKKCEEACCKKALMSCDQVKCACPNGGAGKQITSALAAGSGDCCGNLQCDRGTCASEGWLCDGPGETYAERYQTMPCDPSTDAGFKECFKCCEEIDPCQLVRCPEVVCADGTPAPAPERLCCGALRCCGLNPGEKCPEAPPPDVTAPDCEDPCLNAGCTPDERCEKFHPACAANLTRSAFGTAAADKCCPEAECVPKSQECGGVKCEPDPALPCWKIWCEKPAYLATTTFATDPSMTAGSGSYGQCMEEPMPAGTKCDDNDPSTQEDKCDTNGMCIGTRTEDKCEGDAALECEKLMKNACYSARCMAGQCVAMPKVGKQCKDSTGARGTCSVNGVCEKQQERQDDCMSNPCLSKAMQSGQTNAGQAPTVCVDEDRTLNNLNWRCECDLGLTLQGTQCVMAQSCPPETEKRCKAQRQGCKVDAAGKAQCVKRACPDYAQMCPDSQKPAAGCTRVTPKAGPDGCPEQLSCEWDCPAPAECTDDDHVACDMRARKLKQGYMECAMVNGTKGCKTVDCPLFKCPEARPGCTLVDDFVGGVAQTDEYGCPMNPCGREVCPDECSDEQRLSCEECGELTCDAATTWNWFVSTTVTVTPKVCEMVLADPTQPDGERKAQCVQAACPPISCPKPPKYCAIKPGTDARTDDWGCPLCPEIVCEKAKCTERQQKACCNTTAMAAAAGGSGQRKRVKCLDCVVTDAATGGYECTQKPCETKMCKPRAGCTWVPSNRTDAAGCPINGGCGVESCAPLDPCASKDCSKSPGTECRVISGKAVCAKLQKDSKACAKKQCAAAEKCVENSRGQAECKPKADPCETMRCTPGLVCVAGGSDKKAARCVDPYEAQCKHKDAAGGVGCPTGWMCEPASTMGALAGNSFTRYECVEPPTDPCSRDECACMGVVCDYQTERCSIDATGMPSCVLRTQNAVANVGSDRLVDPCAALSCMPGYHCEVDPVSLASECIQDDCGLSCPPGTRCSADGVTCEPFTCDPPCGSDTLCVSQGGAMACVEDLCARAKFTWPPKGSCYSQADCGSDEICPPRQLSDLSTCMSAYCGCDPRTGGPQQCSGDACDPHLRRCVKREWDCGGALQWPAQREWCCRMASTGCPPEEFICDPAVDGSAPEGWAKDRKEACCTQAQGRAGAPGCAPAGDYNCLTREEWSAAKRDWCCQNKQIGCPGEGGARDCDLPPARMAADTKRWCCENRQQACEKGQLSQIDCSALRVSAAHRPYCCRTEGRHCAPNKGAYSCTGSTDEWSAEQRRYCCAAAKRGCAPEDQRCSPECTIGSPGCADCAHPCDAAPRKGTPRAAWCCATQGVGCEGDDSSGCAELAAGSAERERCCQRWDLGCRYECPSQDDALGLERLAADSQERQDFCWRVRGVAKVGSAVRPAAPTAGSGNTTAPGTAAAGGASASVAVKIKVDWDAVMGKPKVFVNILLQSLLALFLSGDGAAVDSPALLCRELGLLDQDGRGAFDRNYTGPYSAYKLHVGDIFSKAMTTADVDADIAAAARSGRRAHVLRYIRSFTPVDSSDAAYVTVEASAADVDSLNRLVNTIDTSLQSGQTASTKGGSVLALVPATTGSAVQPLAPLPAGAATPTPQTGPGDDKDDGSSPVGPILATLGGLLTLAGLAAVVVRQRRSRGDQAGLMPPVELDADQGAELASLGNTREQYHRTGTDMYPDAIAD